LLTFIYPEIEIGDNIEIAAVQGRVLSAEEYRELLCDPQTWYSQSLGLYWSADVFIALYHKQLEFSRRGVISTEKPIFLVKMLDSWLLLMAYAIENAAKGIIVYSSIKKNSLLKEKAALESFNIKGHCVKDYLRRAFKAKNAKMNFIELKLAEDLAAYAEFAGKYEIGTSYKVNVPNDIIMQSTPAECFELGYFNTIISLYNKVNGWLSADVDEAHDEENKRHEEWSKRFDEKMKLLHEKCHEGHLRRNEDNTLSPCGYCKQLWGHYQKDVDMHICGTCGAMFSGMLDGNESNAA
jgi:hypothetical protein